jgi:four helix bundle protein
MIASHKDLFVWQRSMDLVETVTVSPEVSLLRSSGDRFLMRRAAISVPSNIAEGYGARATGEYRHHVSIGRGSLLELETQILLASRLKYLRPGDVETLLKEIEEISRILATLVSKLS